MSVKALLALVVGSVVFVVGVALLAAAAGSDDPPCPPGKHLITLVVGKAIIPECM